MKSNETFGSPVSKDVINVIEAREAFYKSNTKTPREHSLINSNTAWVKLRSSVNEISPGEQKAFFNDVSGTKIVGGESGKAKNFILFNGTIATKGEPGKKYSESLAAGVAPIDPKEGPYAYNFDARLGYRPMPGITNFKVASKNTYGTLQQAEVDFVVWTLEDLEAAELLYFRPGYTCLLEWGHSVIVDNAGGCTDALSQSFTIPNDVFFEPSTPQAIEDRIAAKRRDLSYSYVALFGFVTNFNWSYRSDGGYDCSIRLISRGYVLDSIKTGNTEDITDTSEEAIEKTKEHRKSIWHAIFQAIEKERTNPKKGGEMDGKAAVKKFYKDSSFANELAPFKAFGYELDIADGKYALFFNETEIQLRYVPLYTIIDIFNNFVALKDPDSGAIFSKFVLDNKNEYLTFPAHFSIDPLVAIIPRIPSGETSDYIIKRSELHSKMASFANSKGGSRRIHNIMVSTEFVKKQIDDVIDAAGQDGIGVLDIIQGILEGINLAFGGVNELDIASVEGGDHIIVDRKNPDPRQTPPTLNLTGLSNTVVDIGLSSKISSQIASQISIAAQGSTGNYKDNVATILKWNSGAIDRHMKLKRGSKASGNASKNNERFEAFIEDLKEVFDDFNERDADYLSDTWSELKSANTAYIQRLYREHNAGKSKKIIQGVVPVELSIKLLGITGFKVGLSFKIRKGILPSKYDDFGYIITGLENEIGTDNRWYTTIKTQFYNIS